MYLTKQERIIDMLVEHGHTKIGVIGGNPETSTASKERLFGCRRAFARNGIAVHEVIPFILIPGNSIRQI